MSIEDFKKYLLERDDRHKNNGDGKSSIGEGEKIQVSPSYDKETAFGSSRKDSTAEEIIKKYDRHNPNLNPTLKPTDQIDPAPNYDCTTTFGEDRR